MRKPPNTQKTIVTSEQGLSSPFDLILKHIPKKEISAFSLRLSPATVYSTLTTLLILTLQRLSGADNSSEAEQIENIIHWLGERIVIFPGAWVFGGDTRADGDLFDGDLDAQPLTQRR